MSSFRPVLLMLGLGTTVALVFTQPAIPQDPAYHVMADQRAWIGIPNTLNVLSNLPFAIVGLVGIAATLHSGHAKTRAFDTAWERWPYLTLFAGTVLTAVGSSYYHLAPDNGRLVWDRLPMTLGFMGLLTAIVAERIGLRTARLLFVPLIAIGVGSVVLWYSTELRGAGDLRLYALVQFGSLILIVLLLALYPSRYPGVGYVVAGLGLYLLAKGFELADTQIFALGQFVSGHTLKHLAAAAAVGCVAQMLKARERRTEAMDGSPRRSSWYAARA